MVLRNWLLKNLLKNFFSNETNKKVLNELEKVLLIKDAILSSDKGLLNNKTFLITGKLNGISRAEVKSLIEEEKNENLKLRVFISGGGCSGFQYGFTFDENIQDGDTSVEKNGVTLLVDPMSFQYLVGAEIDYKEDLEGAQFVIKNPNASTTCGCGSSFSP